jgi:tRNA pseudouridine55 synthase
MHSLRGVLNVNKPAGITSYDVIRRLKPLLAGAKLGHAGTLDPLAQGVILVLVGDATKIADYLQAQEKGYEAVVRLGTRTDTDDITGQVLQKRPVPKLDLATLSDVVARFKGESKQQPPAYSALKVKGVPAYDLARQGLPPVLRARRIVITEIAVIRLALPLFTLRVTVSKGTYIRALARDIGERLGCGATLQGLTRVRAGGFRLADAVPLAGLDRSRLAAGMISISDALGFMRPLVIGPEAIRRLRDGQELSWADATVFPGHAAGEGRGAPPAPGEFVRVADPEQKVLIIAQVKDGSLKSVRGIYADL